MLASRMTCHLWLLALSITWPTLNTSLWASLLPGSQVYITVILATHYLGLLAPIFLAPLSQSCYFPPPLPGPFCWAGCSFYPTGPQNHVEKEASSIWFGIFLSISVHLRMPQRKILLATTLTFLHSLCFWEKLRMSPFPNSPFSLNWILESIRILPPSCELHFMTLSPFLRLRDFTTTSMSYCKWLDFSSVQSMAKDGTFNFQILTYSTKLYYHTSKWIQKSLISKVFLHSVKMFYFYNLFTVYYQEVI